MSLKRILILLLGSGAVAACVSRTPPPAPAPEPTPQVRPQPTAPPPPPPASSDWRDLPLTPGTWTYRSSGNQSQALYGPAGGEGLFGIRCDRTTRGIVLSRAGTGSGALTIRTTTGAKSFAARAETTAAPYLAAAVAPSDPTLDGMAFSRGRFTVETPGAATLIIPSWPEPARVVEDCRA